MFISYLYMFQATVCLSSGEITAFMRHLVLIIVYGWPSGMQEHMLLHTRQSPIRNNNLCDTWYLLFCMDDCLFAGAYAPAHQTVTHTGSCIPESHPYRIPIYATLGTCYSVWMTVWYEGAYAPAYQTVTHTGSCIPESHPYTIPIYATLGTCYSLRMTVWYAGAYAPAYQTVTHTGSCIPESHPYRIRIYATLSTCYSVWTTGMQEHMLLHTRQLFIQNNKYQVSHKYSFFLLMMGTLSPEICREKK